MKSRDLAADLGLCGAPGAPVSVDPSRVSVLVRQRLSSAPVRGSSRVRKTKRAALVALAAVLLLSATVLANSGVLSVKQKGLTDQPFFTLPSQEQAMDAAGFVPVMPERLSAGFRFAYGWLNEYVLNEPGGSEYARPRCYYFVYESSDVGDGGTRAEVELREIPWQDGKGVSFLEGEPVAEIDGVTVCDLERDLLTGDAQETGVVLHALHWQQGGIQFRLKEFDPVGLDALMQMAEELIRIKAG